MQTVKTILADDQCIFIEGLKAVLYKKSSLPIDVVDCAFNGKELMEIVRRESADLLILDLKLPEKDGLEVLKILRKERVPIQVLILSRYDDPKIVKTAFKYGADGYILKDKNVTELFTAIREVLAGNTFIGEGVSVHKLSARRFNGKPATAASVFQDSFVKRHKLTKREVEILRLITEALSNKEIARELYISDQTVSVHRKNIMRKLGVSNTAALIKTAYDNSLV
jgi:DNA-binding NarL/FixJ family response regulator